MAEDLEALEPWLQGYLDRLAPAQRRKAAQAIGQQARKANARRIAANVQPDGSAMAPRKQKKRLADRHGKVRRTAKMFRRIATAKNLRMRINADGAEIGFAPRTARTAAIHHFGLEDKVDQRIPSSPLVKYTGRRLLGFSPEDRQAILDTAIRMVEGS